MRWQSAAAAGAERHASPRPRHFAGAAARQAGAHLRVVGLELVDQHGDGEEIILAVAVRHLSSQPR